MMEERRRYIGEEFKKLYGKRPTIWARAPGRVDLMGSHTDYNMGFVMTMTIDRDTWLAANPREDGRVTIHSCNASGGASFSLDDIQRDEEVPWTNYIRGIAAALKESGYCLLGFDGLVHSTIAFGSGLSSSAAIEMAAALIFTTISGLEIGLVDLALLGQKAENEFVGVRTGILDQYSSIMGQQGCAILLDCRQLTSEIVPMNPGMQVVICNTRAERNLVGTEYDERHEQCEAGVRFLQRFYPEITALRDVTPDMLKRHRRAMPVVIARRCQFIVEENQRVLDLYEILPEDHPGLLHDLFTASYRGARDLYEIGAPSMAAMFHAMSTAPGVIASRQAGAGFGGSMVALVKAGYLDQFTKHVTKSYQQETRIQPEVYSVESAPGAMILEWV
ncbi:MAG TPA: galactokinase [candidate division Zixibacteria bacterium]|nr:galactokinase [candidate division Zixibacteria bacterium]